MHASCGVTGAQWCAPAPSEGAVPQGAGQVCVEGAWEADAGQSLREKGLAQGRRACGGWEAGGSTGSPPEDGPVWTWRMWVDGALLRLETLYDRFGRPEVADRLHARGSGR